MAVPNPAFTTELYRLSFGEQPLAAALETPVAGASWLGKVQGGWSGLGFTSRQEQRWHAGDGRLPSESVDLGVDVGPISGPYELQDGRFLVMLYGHVSDVGTVQPSAPGGSTLSAAAAPGDTDVTLVSEADYLVGEFIEIGTDGVAPQDPEIRTITSLAPISFTEPLRTDHDSGLACAERIAPFTHTLRVSDPFPLPFTFQSVLRPGLSNETGKSFAGCFMQEATLQQDLREVLTCTPTVIGSRPGDIVPPATLPTPITTASYTFAQAAYTYFGSPLAGVQSHRTVLRNGGDMKHWSRSTLAEYAAEYVPDQAQVEHEMMIINRDDTIWDQLLLRASGLSATVLYTRGTGDTLSINMTGGVLQEAPDDLPASAEVTTPMRLIPAEAQLVFVDSIPGY